MDFEDPSSTTLDKNKLWAWHTDVDVLVFPQVSTTAK